MTGIVIELSAGNVPIVLTSGVTCHMPSLPKFQPDVLGRDEALIGQREVDLRSWPPSRC